MIVLQMPALLSHNHFQHHLQCLLNLQFHEILQNENYPMAVLVTIHQKSKCQKLNYFK